jgi:hypothetical protein
MELEMRFLTAAACSGANTTGASAAESDDDM